MEAKVLSELHERASSGALDYVANLAAAEHAVRVGQFNLAKVLRAVGHCRRVMATRAARFLIGDTDPQVRLQDNLHEGGALRVVREASAETGADGEAELDRLHKIDRKTNDLIARSLQSLARHADVSEEDVAQVIWGCYGCGNLMEGDPPDACPECGALSAEFEWFGPFYSSTPEHLGSLTPDEVLATLETIPEQVGGLVGRADDDELGRRPAEDEWSVKEIIGHIIEVEALFNQRVSFILESEGEGNFSTKVPPWKLQDNKGYEGLEKQDLLDRLSASRHTTLDMLRRLEAKQWSMSGGIQGGQLSVIELAVWLTNHDVGHVAQIKRYV